MNQNAKQLIAALREADSLPEGAVYHVPGDGLMTWDFQEFFVEEPCGFTGCAVGLAHAMGIIPEISICKLADALGITGDKAYDIFTGGFGGHLYGKPRSEVRPGEVADRLEAVLLAKQSWKRAKASQCNL